MKTKLLFFILTALFVTTAYLPVAIGKDYWQWHLPVWVNELRISPIQTEICALFLASTRQLMLYY